MPIEAAMEALCGGTKTGMSCKLYRRSMFAVMLVFFFLALGLDTAFVLRTVRTKHNRKHRLFTC